MASDFAGRAALVTGAGRGIGRAVAGILDGAGARLAVAARGERSARAAAEDIGARSGRTPLVLWGDLAGDGVAERIVGETAQRLGRLDVLVHCAGAFDRCAALESTAARFEATIATNLHGTFLAACAAARAMSHGGSVVLVSSMWARRGGAGRAAYCASKAGVEALVPVLAAEWGERGIGVYCVAPGWVRTTRNVALVEAGAMDLGRMTAVAPQEPLIEPEEVAELLAELAAGRHPMLSGSVVRLDGGMSNWIGSV